MTLMVRDEADIVGAMLRHHFEQGIDHVIATDNASVDGTTEILESYAKMGLLTLQHDPRHQKQQSEVVTRMAREAATLHDATWVINADADEFWVAEDTGRSLREVFADISTEYRSFEVPVTDMTGVPALEGSGLSRLTLRDRRPVARMNALGHHAHATNNYVFVADPVVKVAQGNHFVNIESQGRPEPGRGIEVLHLPWRSWKQLSRKVENAGLAYERSGLTPSPNHHGMRDYRRLRNGLLYSYYLARHPNRAEREVKAAELVEDRRLADTLCDPVLDISVTAREWETAVGVVESLVRAERNLLELQDKLSISQVRAEQLEDHVEQLEEVQRGLVAEVDRFRSSRVIRALHAAGRFRPNHRE